MERIEQTAADVAADLASSNLRIEELEGKVEFLRGELERAKEAIEDIRWDAKRGN